MLHEMGLMYRIPTPTTSYPFFWTFGAKFGARCHSRRALPCTTGASHMRSQCGHRERQKWSNKRPRRRAVPKLGNTFGAQVQSSSKTQLSSKLNANPTWPIHASSNWPKPGGEIWFFLNEGSSISCLSYEHLLKVTSYSKGKCWMASLLKSSIPTEEKQ